MNDDALLEEALAFQQLFTGIGPGVATRTTRWGVHDFRQFPFNRYDSFWLYMTRFRSFMAADIGADGIVTIGSLKSHRSGDDTEIRMSTITGECVRYNRCIDSGSEGPFTETHRYASFVDLLEHFVADCKRGEVYTTDLWNCSAPLG